uniref:Uncharacterized protein n=1 Tax=Anguilla anguilla TaxID=7936 RepID=A0A0E9VGW0_ANGAN
MYKALFIAPANCIAYLGLDRADGIWKKVLI